MLLHNFWFKYHQNKFVLEDDTIVPSAEEHVVLGTTIDSRATFYSHLKQLKRIPPVLVITKGDSFRCPVFYWTIKLLPLNIDLLFQIINHLINKLQERALRITYNHYDSSFSELLEMPDESTIHIKNIKVLMTAIYKSLDDLHPQ